MNGKGDKNRTGDYKSYFSNHDNIEWEDFMGKLKQIKPELSAKTYVLVLEDKSEWIITRNSISSDVWNLKTDNLNKEKYGAETVDRILQIQPDNFNTICKSVQKAFKKKIVNIL